ncbi:transmembrane protein 106B-like [Myripristis murdjan]|uniref:transmembrane protein 106B-like n=1 Tax=Myripristis murdjan TaxID=586833 RepID=UPI001175CEC2|nr:transmembrane protein 106B-like [Myripristis murdjan]XP_029914347.1 transmembrane protein 106B-like [Myripristis murdjan]XP_029914348.1 transmembrane protein 106B-like [Myripristis murdjan]
MGTFPSRPVGGKEGAEIEHSGSDCQPIIEQDESKRRGSSRRHDSAETLDCPTCQGTGRIPRGQESKLVAVIPCNDQRLKPRHTKLYVAVSVAVCLLVSSLVLFFLFPRSVILSPVAVQSVFVYFTEDTVQMNVTNVLNITNHNFAEVQAYNLTVQALNYNTVVGTVSVQNVTTVEALSNKMYSFVIPIKLTDSGLNKYCKSKSIPIHTLFLHLEMSMTVYYLAHYEQLSLDTYEFIDCGSNTTTPHSVHLSPP